VGTLVQNDDFDLLGLANGEHQFRTLAQQAVFVGHDQPTDTVGQDVIEEAFQALIVVVYPRPDVGHNLEGPTLAGTVEFQHWLLSFEVVFLVVT